MALSVTEKQYWTGELQRAIEDRIQNLVETSGQPYFLRDAHAVVMKEVKEEVGIVSLEDEERRLLSQLGHLEVRLAEVKAKKRMVLGARTDIDASVRLDQLARQHLPEVLSRDELGRQVLVFIQKQETVERAIWSQTSARQLVDFLRDVFGELGVSLEV